MYYIYVYINNNIYLYICVKNIIHKHHHPITLHSGLGLGSALVPPSNNERLDRWDSKWSNANINVQGHMELNMTDMIWSDISWYGNDLIFLDNDVITRSQGRRIRKDTITASFPYLPKRPFGTAAVSKSISCEWCFREQEAETVHLSKT